MRPMYPTPRAVDYKGSNGTGGLLPKSGFNRLLKLCNFVPFVLENITPPNTGGREDVMKVIAEERKKLYEKIKVSNPAI